MMRRFSQLVSGGLVAAMALAGGFVLHAEAVELPSNDFPTAARADYVFACMETNGRNRDVLMRCSCSIDKIAELLPYQKYEQAETLISIGMRGGENASWMITAPQNKKKIDELKLAQVEAELLCF